MDTLSYGKCVRWSGKAQQMLPCLSQQKYKNLISSHGEGQALIKFLDKFNFLFANTKHVHCWGLHGKKTLKVIDLWSESNQLRLQRDIRHPLIFLAFDALSHDISTVYKKIPQSLTSTP